PRAGSRRLVGSSSRTTTDRRRGGRRGGGPVRTVVVMQAMTSPPVTAGNGVAAARAVAATKTYGTGSTAVTALDDVTVDLPAGRFTAVMGPAGSGKSTLMHCLAGLDDLTLGQVFIGDVELNRLSEKE